MFDVRPLTETAVQAPGRYSPCLLRQPVIAARMTMAEIMRFVLDLPGSRDLAELENHSMLTRRLHRGRTLVNCGQEFESLYVVLSGALASTLNDATECQQVVAFPMPGDVIGLDALPTRRYPTAAVALDESNVAVLPWRELMQIGHEVPQLGEWLTTLTAVALGKRHEAMSILASVGAEVRLARFLLHIGERYGSLGFSPRRFNLRMSRREIASYLGLTVETTCRAFTALVNLGYIGVRGREVELFDVESLKRAEELGPRRNRFGLSVRQRQRRMVSGQGATPTLQ